MRYGEFLHPQTGIAVPLTSIRTEEQLGVGEFLDLPAFGEWARESGFELVQILPVQDTGGDASPYAGRTAFGLHPVHLRLEAIEGSDALHAEIEALRQSLGDPDEVDVTRVMSMKGPLLRRIFDQLDAESLWTRLAPWVEQNPWIRAHAAYCFSSERHDGGSWQHWPEMRDPSEADLDRLWEIRSSQLLYHVWLQSEADAQLIEASQALDAMGIRLKGDLPILLDENSSDVWFHRPFFDLDARAGAPPDMYAEHGQSWGFPTYRWDALAKADYSWWRQRLRRASRYYHALRIDHVLGFFRIWSIPPRSETAMLGWFDPSIAITREELRAYGFGDERIDELAAPEGKPEADFPPESKYASVDDEEERLALMRRLWNRVLLPIDESQRRFRFYWYWTDSGLYQSLDDQEKSALHALAEDDAKRQEELWERTGLERLRMIEDSTDALVCAEDLGAVPACVPPVLQRLGILGLRVERWMRDWDEHGQPFRPPSGFGIDTVCSPSTHDANSLRAWWEESEDDRRAYWQALGKDGDPPPVMDVELLHEVLVRNLAADSRLCVLSLPDVLALDEELRPADPAAERINVPGTPSEFNWRWRMPVTVRDLRAREALRERLATMIETRRERETYDATSRRPEASAAES